MQETRGASKDARREREGERDGLPAGLSIEDLAEATDLPIRTIRYYISEGLLPGPGSRGKQAAYGEEQLARLRLIRRLAERHVPLAQMRELLAPLALDDVWSLLAEEERRTAELQLAEQAPSPKEYVSGLLKRAKAAREVSTSPGSGQAQRYLPWGSPEAMSAHQLPSESRSDLPNKPSPRQPTFSLPSSAASPAAAPQPAEAWQRWKLAPGVELNVRTDAERQYRGLIRRVLAAARDEAQEDEA